MGTKEWASILRIMFGRLQKLPIQYIFIIFTFDPYIHFHVIIIRFDDGPLQLEGYIDTLRHIVPSYLLDGGKDKIFVNL